MENWLVRSVGLGISVFRFKIPYLSQLIFFFIRYIGLLGLAVICFKISPIAIDSKYIYVVIKYHEY